MKTRGFNIKKGDIIIILSVCFAAFFSAIILFLPKHTGNTVVISQNNEIIGEYRLYDDRNIELEHNRIVIKNGRVTMLYSSCKNQICVKHSSISKVGESIICLPNKVLVEIKKD